jgi:hypothetical protein
MKKYRVTLSQTIQQECILELYDNSLLSAVDTAVRRAEYGVNWDNVGCSGATVTDIEEVPNDRS